MVSAPPPSWAGRHLVLEPLRAELVDLDTAAYLASPLAITAHSHGRWPLEGFTREENLRLITQHEREHDAGEAFALAVLTPARDRELGCVYWRQLTEYLARTGTHLAAPAESAMLTFWLIDEAAARPSATTVLADVGRWLREWKPLPTILRVATAETASIAAALALALPEIEASGQPRPYRWFAVGAHHHGTA